MAKAPTLIDHLYRASFRNEPTLGWSNHASWRAAFQRAHRFVLDDAMSTFLGELSTQAFAKTDMRKKENGPLRAKMAEHLRMGARLPFPTTWIEYDARLSLARIHQILGRPFDPKETPKTEGWLLQQHPHLDTAILAHIITHDAEKPDGLMYDTWCFPLALAWTVDIDTVLPWRLVRFNDEKGLSNSEATTGLVGYRTDRAGWVTSDWLQTFPNQSAYIELVKEWSGVQRRMWALLATLADLPVELTEARVSKGFVAKGAYRKFLSHKTVTLTVPVAKYRKTARIALAAAHRRAHPVRAHWRKDWRNPLSPLCEHDFTADELHMTCGICKGRKSHVKDHMRGDAGRGVITHDYQITHESEPTP
jgi:hypothetical protein